MKNIEELTKLLEERKNVFLGASERLDSKGIDMKIVSLILESICDDEPIILLDENAIKDIVCGKSVLFFGVVSSTITELDYEIRKIFNNQQGDSEFFDATNILIYISCGNDISMQIINKIASEIKQYVNAEVPMKIGCGISNDRDIIHVFIVGSKNTKKM